MAKEAPAAEAAPAKPKNRMKLLIIALVVTLFVLVIGAAAAVLLLSGTSGDGSAEEAETDEEAVTQEEEDAPKTAPVFSDLGDFIVNLLPNPAPAAASAASESGMFTDEPQPMLAPYEENRFLQVKIVLELDNAKSDALIKAQMPRIRNSLTVLLSNKTAKNLSSKDGKEALAGEIMAEINNIIIPPVKGRKQKSTVISVLFDSFLIQ